MSLAFIIAVDRRAQRNHSHERARPVRHGARPLFFSPLGRLSPTRACRSIAIWVQAIWACVLALSGTFDQITTSRDFRALDFLRARRVVAVRAAAETAGGAEAIPHARISGGADALFVAVAVWLVVNSIKAYPVESSAGLLMIALGLPFYMFFQRGAAKHHLSDHTSEPGLLG